MKNSVKNFLCFLLCGLSLKCASAKASTAEDKMPPIILETNFDRTLRKMTPYVKNQMERTFNNPEIFQNPEKYLERKKYTQSDVIKLGTNIFRDYFRNETDVEDRTRHRIQKAYKDFIDDEERDNINELHISQRNKEEKFQKSLEGGTRPMVKTKFRNRIYRGEARYLLESNIFNAEIDARLFNANKLRARLYTKKITFKELGLNIFGNVQYNSGSGGNVNTELVMASMAEWAVIFGNYNDMGEYRTDNRLTFQYNTNF